MQQMLLDSDAFSEEDRTTFTEFIETAKRPPSKAKQKHGSGSACCCKSIKWSPSITGGEWRRKKKTGPATTRGGMSRQEIQEYQQTQAAQCPISTFDLLFAIQHHKQRVKERVLREWKRKKGTEAKHHDVATKPSPAANEWTHSSKAALQESPAAANDPKQFTPHPPAQLNRHPNQDSPRRQRPLATLPREA